MNQKILSLTAAIMLTLSSYAVSVETDRAWYVAGETMAVNVTDNDALIAYAELCDTHGLAAGVVVNVKRGRALMHLPADLHSGYYMLSVYTRHNAKVAHRLVAVVNTLRRSADDDMEWVEVSHPDSLSYPMTGISPSTFHLPSSTIPVDMRETEGHILKARIKNVYDGHTFKSGDICPSLSVVGKQIHYFEGEMINDSVAVFRTFGIQGKQTVVLSAMANGTSLPIEMMNPFVTILPETLPHLVFHYNRNEVEARSIDMQRHRKDTASVVALDYDERVFSTVPDLSYNLDEYRQFLTIREVLLEYVSCVRKTRINGVSRLIVRRGEDHYNRLLPSLVLIDGMPVIDIDRLMDYDARRVHYINIYGGQYVFGNGVYNGILSVVTRSGRLTNYPTEPNTQYLVYDFPE